MPVEPKTHADWIRQSLTTYESPLLRYALRLCNGDMERARDAVQDTFLRLCRQERTDIDDHLAPWLYTVCRNRILELRRKEGRMSPLSDERLAVTEADIGDPATEAEKQDTLNTVTDLLGTLPPRQQEVIRLKFQNELSYKQISSITKLSVSNVGYLIHTGIRTLRQRLRQQEA
jgi:RNA polymerase sigma-70 factor (ECF subfamily)